MIIALDSLEHNLAAGRAGGRSGMQNHLVYSSNTEQKVREYDTDDDPPELGDLVILPFGPNDEMCPYRVVDRYFLSGRSRQDDFLH